MTDIKTVLLLVGSPFGFRSTSSSLGSYLMDRLTEKGFTTNKVHIHKSVKSQEGIEELLHLVGISDLVVLTFPLYVDSLPAPIIKAMEIITKHHEEAANTRRQKFIAISNSGFPEASQILIALEICRCFAQRSGFEWAGGLALGMGPAIRRKPLDEVGGMARNVKKALDLTAHALSEEKAVPEEATKLMEKSIIPRTLYMWMGNRGWKQQAKKNRVLDRIRVQPHLT
ncbi:MAG: hypothetical protein KAJ96_08510 [Candidatus Thorarchaeota archaeon]|nr:hypothetical protein [Candidatus Thorarchaeota archaeon]